MEKIQYQIGNSKKVVIPENPGFGIVFTNHVFEMDYNPAEGWHNPVIKPLENLSVHPGTMFIHYGQTIFEGMKAFRTINNEIAVFRPDKHFERLNNSARRLCIPQVDPSFLLNALIELLNVEKDWVPSKEGQSLYIRPFIFGNDPFLGVKPSSSYKLIILLSPVGAYYPEGFKPVKILAQDEYVRAVRKGIGEAKTAGNYAASLLAGQEAAKRGFSQVLWLDGVELKNIDEVGAMNVFIALKDEIVTPKLNGAILPGITRMSVIEILQSWGKKVSEREISIYELIEQYDNGNVECMFGTGTAAIISSIGTLQYKNKILNFNDGQPCELELKLFEEITSIQTGRSEDRYNWLTYIDKVKMEV